jgi:hypothetical protein
MVMLAPRTLPAKWVRLESDGSIVETVCNVNKASWADPVPQSPGVHGSSQSHPRLRASICMHVSCSYAKTQENLSVNDT